MKTSMKDRYAFLFPGVGMAYKKYLNILDQSFLDQLSEYCESTYRIIGVNVWKHINGEPETNYDRELIDQILIYTVNCFIFEAYLQNGLIPGVLVGYSMGYYSALNCSNAISYSTGLKLIVKAYKIMKKHTKGIKGGMYVVIGLTIDQVRDLIDNNEMKDKVYIANQNSKYNIVVSGLSENLKKLSEIVIAQGALRVVDLDITIPYHTVFMKECANEFRDAFNNLNITDPKIPLISSITQKTIYTCEDAKRELYSNLQSSMSWEKTIKTAGVLGFEKFVEVGLGDSLCRLSSFINEKFTFYSFKKTLKEEVHSA